ncbi:MAG: MFS transporter [Candidatus Woesearchaeota archaeon]
MRQVTKFYITSFLKNQTYFTPILVIFLQAQNLDYSQIFWVFTIGSIFSLLIEIPTGVFADLYGKRKSIMISKLGIFLSYIAYGLAGTFWSFVIAQILFELGNAFRTGTETAYTFDYLEQNPKGNPKYTEVKGKQKFYARIGESVATAAGGFLAARLGYSWVFFIAAIPAFFNFVLSMRWEKIREKDHGFTMKNSLLHTKDSMLSLIRKRHVMVIIINIMIFSSVLAALNKFIQPYMKEAGIAISMFGVIYSASLILTAIAVRYSYLFERLLGGSRRTMNILSFLAVIPILILGSRFISIVGVLLFFLVVIIENIRSPIANNEFHQHVSSKQRATLGSALSLFKSLGKIMILPFAGYLADGFSLYTAILVMGIILVLNSLVFFIRSPEKIHD